MILLVDSPDLKSVTLVTLEAIKLENYIIALFSPLDWHWAILVEILKEGGVDQEAPGPSGRPHHCHHRLHGELGQAHK